MRQIYQKNSAAALVMRTAAFLRYGIIQLYFVGYTGQQQSFFVQYTGRVLLDILH